jgi:hypothetical protein
MFLSVGFSAEAQQPNRVHRVGYLSPAASTTATASIEPFRQGLRALGYVEGQNIVIEAIYKRRRSKVPRFRCRVGPSQGRLHCNTRHSSHPVCKASEQHDSDSNERG